MITRHWLTSQPQAPHGGTAAMACFCVGPQPGFPRCPCMMRGLVQRDGRWVEPERDLGPVAPAYSEGME